MGIDIENDRIIYQLTTRQLEGSWDSKVSIRVTNERYEQDDKGHVRLTKTGWYVIIEASIHKLVYGHNVYCGWDDFQKAAAFLISMVESGLDVKLPKPEHWEVRRIDVSENYYLPSPDAVTEWFRMMNLKKYPRRKMAKYGECGLYANGTTTTWKAYHKGPDFKKHDYKRVKWHRGKETADRIHKLAMNIIRFEIEIKKKKLQDDYKKKIVKVKDINNDYLKKLYDSENQKIIREGEDMRIARTTIEVQNRLKAKYNDSWARILLGTWLKFSAFGEEESKREMPRATFYRHRKMLKDLGISWTGTDISIEYMQSCPIDFQPYLNSRHRLTYEAGEELMRLLG